jgi:polyferredoxin
MQVDVISNLKAHGQIRSLDCIRCLKCIDECQKGAIAFSMRPQRDVSLSTDAANRAEKASLKRRRLSAFDVTIVVLWIGLTLFFTFTTRQSAPQEIKVTMAAGSLLVIYGVVWLAQKAWQRFRRISRRPTSG